MPKVVQSQRPVKEEISLLTKVRRYINIKRQVDDLTKEQTEIKVELSEVVDSLGEFDAKGHKIFELPEEVDGYVSLQRQRRVSQKLDEDEAKRILTEKNLTNRCYKLTPVLDEDAVMSCLYEGLLTEEDIDTMFPKTETWAFIPLKRQGQGMGDTIDNMFGDMDEYYPGSKRKRRAPDPNAKPKKKVSEDSWDSEAQLKKLPNGNVIELFSAGAMSQALGRPLVTLRLWERKGYIPRAPYRLKSMMVNGVKKPGWRMYSRAIVETTIESFSSRGLLEAPRVDWNRHQDLSIELVDKWREIHDQETK